ncbi:membrane metallo-endopeptidase-like 1 [Dendronephthya gigantea]|uniref:membrane metallo-endopeptidase-like 1 n=1 Tax=Dendronephthya gigantea TaxID=151771 RepID=UPI00106951F9|nr:membrane metallo-endopeptidase-like 1 [Dendronephthya gigantea]
MASLKCVQPQTTSTLSILRDLNGNVPTSEGGSIGVSRPSLISKIKMHRYSKLEIFLAIVSLLLLVSLVVVVVLLESENIEKTSEEKTSQEEGPRGTEAAIKSLARVLNNIDKDADPCTDFYQYACGGWEKRNYIEDSQPYVFPFVEVQKENKRQLKEILENMEVKANYSDNPAMLKAFEMYSSCMNTTAVERFGDSELRRILRVLADFDNTWNNRSSYDWKDFVVKIKRQLNLDTLFKIVVLDDLRDASIQRITMQAVQMPLSYANYFVQNSTQETRARYVKFMTDVMMLVTDSKIENEVVKEEMSKVLDLETSIAKAQIIPSQRRNFTLIYNLISIEKLTKMTQKFDWLSFFGSLTSDIGFSLTPSETLIITSPKMVQDILNTLNRTEPSVISNYLAWRIIYDVIKILPLKYRKLYNAFRDDQTSTLWDTCVQDTSSTLPLETTLLFAQRTLPKGTVNEARSIMRDVRDTFIDIIPKQSWMDKNTQTKAIEKVKAMIFHIAYPSNETVAENMLKNSSPKFTVSNTSYLTTYLNVKSFTFMENFKLLKATFSRNKWDEIDPMKPTGFYYHTRNKVGISVGFLQSKLFSLENYKSANFGGFGMVIGHEISHGYDLIGHRFDKHGDMTKWMSHHSSNILRQKHACLEKSYSNLALKGRKIGRIRSYRQQFCDIGGINLAFEAYMEWKNRSLERGMLPSLNITHNQLFFLSYAQMWCAKYKASEVSRMVNEGNYPFPLRVQGAMLNSEEFADAFSCAPGTTMNPIEKCKVWET